MRIPIERDRDATVCLRCLLIPLRTVIYTSVEIESECEKYVVIIVVGTAVDIEDGPAGRLVISGLGTLQTLGVCGSWGKNCSLYQTIT